MCYFYYYSYPWADYLEYPVLVLQNLVLFAIVAISGNVSVRKASSAVFGYATAVAILCSGILPSFLINFLSVSYFCFKYKSTGIFASYFYIPHPKNCTFSITLQL